MPTIVKAHPWIVEAVKQAGSQVIRIGTKPWAHFKGPNAEERAKRVVDVYERLHGYRCRIIKPWRDDQDFDCALRLD